jgi:hypothetical protein
MEAKSSALHGMVKERNVRERMRADEVESICGPLFGSLSDFRGEKSHDSVDIDPAMDKLRQSPS